MIRFSTVLLLLAVFAARAPTDVHGDELDVHIRQITRGPRHHFYGYIGHVMNVPWNATGRYVVALETDFQDHLPAADEPANVVLLDSQHDFAPILVEATRAWNFQQGTMLYWNPAAPDHQFFFNDRDAETGRVFTVLYDVAKRERVREYRLEPVPAANGGVCPAGGFFLAINYGRLARLRPVTGYAGAADPTAGVVAPTDDGIFKVDIATGEARLLVSYQQLADLWRSEHPDVDRIPLFINHTLASRDGAWIYFFVRGNFGLPNRINVPCSVRADGSELTLHRQHIGGHPEWDLGHRLIGRVGSDQVLYDVEEQSVVGTLGSPELFPDPEGDVALSPDGRRFANGYRVGAENSYAILDRETGAFVRTRGFPHAPWRNGALRLDAAPCWNRAGTALVVPGLADDAARTRQMFLIELRAPPE